MEPEDNSEPKGPIVDQENKDTSTFSVVRDSVKGVQSNIYQRLKESLPVPSMDIEDDDLSNLYIFERAKPVRKPVEPKIEPDELSSILDSILVVEQSPSSCSPPRSDVSRPPISDSDLESLIRRMEQSYDESIVEEMLWQLHSLDKG